ncbi:unnamed protein product [Trichobilharzia regenti]|nr:unnamed protein product [Trichobilharzia regenti]
MQSTNDQTELRERVLRGTYRVPYYMTHECEMLLKKMLVLNPAKRITLQEVMNDPWINQGYEHSVLKPHTEEPADYCDPERIDIMMRMGFKREDIHDSLTQQRFNNITATYLLLARYDPRVHGRLRGLPSTSTTSLKSDNPSARSRQTPETQSNTPNTSRTHFRNSPVTQHNSPSHNSLGITSTNTTNSTAAATVTQHSLTKGITNRITESTCLNIRNASTASRSSKDTVTTTTTGNLFGDSYITTNVNMSSSNNANTRSGTHGISSSVRRSATVSGPADASQAVTSLSGVLLKSSVLPALTTHSPSVSRNVSPPPPSQAPPSDVSHQIPATATRSFSIQPQAVAPLALDEEDASNPAKSRRNRNQKSPSVENKINSCNGLIKELSISSTSSEDAISDEKDLYDKDSDSESPASVKMSRSSRKSQKDRHLSRTNKNKTPTTVVSGTGGGMTMPTSVTLAAAPNTNFNNKNYSFSPKEKQLPGKLGCYKNMSS